MFERCYVCKKIVWPWQRKVRSLDRNYVAHKHCKPDGFHGLDDEGKVISG